MPTVYHAFRIYSDPHGVTRSALDARALADEPPQAIAAKSATAAAAVCVYELLFYDVRGRLKSPDYIFNQVIGSRLRDNTTGWDYDLVWRFFGYIGGPFVLDDIIDNCGAATQPANVLAVPSFLSEDAQAAVRRQVAIAARALRGATARWQAH